MADKEKDNATEEETKKKSSSGNLLPMINLVLTLVVLVLGGFIAWKLVTLEIPIMPGDGQPSPAVEVEKTPGILMEMDNVTVNLADLEESRFLRVKIKFEVENEEDKLRVEGFNTQIKDLIITTLSSKSFDDVRTAQGKFALKEELTYRINSLLGGRPVKKLYFSDFVAQ